MAELLQRPWAIMFWRDTLRSKAKVAPDLLKVWKPWRTGDIFKLKRTFLRASLTWVSIMGEKGGKLLANKGWEGDRGRDERRAWRALTGQSMMLSSVGSWTIWCELKLWRVLVHLISQWAPGSAKMRSCLRKWWVGSKALALWEATLDILKNAKNAVKKIARNKIGSDRVSQAKESLYRV